MAARSHMVIIVPQYALEELRDVLGLPPSPLPPAEAWEETLDEVRELRAAAARMGYYYNDEMTNG